MNDVQVRRLAPRDEQEWLALYLRYAQTVHSTHTGFIQAQTVWAWLMNHTHRLEGLGAFASTGLAGFVHYRPFPRTLDGNEACYLDDLYVDDAMRGRSIARRLIESVCDEAGKRHWTEVRWVTDPSNGAAQRLYDDIAERSGLITYRLYLAQRTA